ncbi:SAM-dependent methyltransferase, partial [Microbacterium sp.]|uniref:SAM-dependent methyltransferase n=1 Tax=Microbacterium sp. TaxID=51671 RepID=UPI003C708A1F
VVDAVADLAPHAQLQLLGIPDGAVREHADLLQRRLAAIIAEAEADTRTGTDRGTAAGASGHPRVATLLVAPWWGDGHRDHRVAGEVALRLAGEGVRVLGYPVWMWHWADPDEVDAAAWRVLPLDEQARSAKNRALGRHRSQTTATAGAPPILHEGMRAHFDRDLEVFIEPPGTSQSTPVDTFSRHYRERHDPWGVRTRWYERRKRALLAALLPHEHYGRALEIGSGVGELTAELAVRCNEVVAIDVAAEAVERTRERVARHPHVHVTRADARTDLGAVTGAPFDLVVLSEIGYYWSAADLAAVLDAIDAVGTDLIAACHWRHLIGDAPQTGDAVHAALARRAGARVARYADEDVIIEVFAPGGAPSVARAEGLVP